METIKYQFSHADMQELVNIVGNMPWVVAQPAMEILKRVQEIKIDLNKPKEQLELPNVEGK